MYDKITLTENPHVHAKQLGTRTVYFDDWYEQIGLLEERGYVCVSQTIGARGGKVQVWDKNIRVNMPPIGLLQAEDEAKKKRGEGE